MSRRSPFPPAVLCAAALATTALALAGCSETAAPTPGDPAERPSLSAATVTQNVVVPIEQTVFIPCANRGAGEDVVLRGNLHVLLHITQNGRTFVVHTQANPQGVVGTGTVTGATYHATGITLETFSVSKGVRDTFINNFRIIGPGATASLLIHEVLHITVNAAGRATVSSDRLRVECR